MSVTPIHDAIRDQLDAEAPVRLAAVALRKFTRDPESREASARMLLLNAVRICAAQVGTGAAAVLAAEAVAELAQADRRKARG